MRPPLARRPHQSRLLLRNRLLRVRQLRRRPFALTHCHDLSRHNSHHPRASMHPNQHSTDSRILPPPTPTPWPPPPPSLPLISPPLNPWPRNPLPQRNASPTTTSTSFKTQNQIWTISAPARTPRSKTAHSGIPRMAPPQAPITAPPPSIPPQQL